VEQRDRRDRRPEEGDEAGRDPEDPEEDQGPPLRADAGDDLEDAVHERVGAPEENEGGDRQSGSSAGEQANSDGDEAPKQEDPPVLRQGTDHGPSLLCAAMARRATVYFFFALLVRSGLLVRARSARLAVSAGW